MKNILFICMLYSCNSFADQSNPVATTDPSIPDIKAVVNKETVNDVANGLSDLGSAELTYIRRILSTVSIETSRKDEKIYLEITEKDYNKLQRLASKITKKMNIE